MAVGAQAAITIQAVLQHTKTKSHMRTHNTKTQLHESYTVPRYATTSNVSQAVENESGSIAR